MAKSKSGGTRSYIRGRVGADVYSIGKDAKGSKQQVVRSLAESVANPQTQAQMVQRMLMTTASEACKVLKPIIDHSFDGVPAGQPSISKFMEVNLPILKDFYQNGAQDGYQFALNKYQEHAGLCGAFVVSQGRKRFNTFAGGGWKPEPGIADMNLELTSTTPIKENKVTFGDFKKVWPVGADGVVTVAGIGATGPSSSRFIYFQLKLRSDVADTFAIATYDATTHERLTKCDPEDIFEIEANVEVTNYIMATEEADGDTTFCGIKLDGVTSADIQGCAIAVIGSWKTKDGYQHNNAQLDGVLTGTANYRDNSTVLETYPKGTERFLNGGDL